MNKTVVSLVSDQTAPNVYFIKNNLNADKFLFITTEEMEGKGVVNNIINALPVIGNRVERIVVDNRYPYKIIDSLKKYVPQDTDSSYYVNITGGTKMMSLSAFSYFAKWEKCSIYYIPEKEEHFISIHHSKALKADDLGKMEFLTLEEYIKSYGTTTVNISKKPLESLETAERCFNWIFKRYNLKKNSDYERIEKPRDYLLKQNLNSSEKARYLGGGWLEEYVYLSLLKSSKLKEGNIYLNAKIQRKGKENELDVVFLHRNKLAVVECKSGKDDKDEVLYKLKAVSDGLGFLMPYLFIAHKVSSEERKRAELLKISVVDIDDMKKGILSGFGNLFN